MGEITVVRLASKNCCLGLLVFLFGVSMPAFSAERVPACFTNRRVEPVTGDVVGYTLALHFHGNQIEASLCTFQGGSDPTVTSLTGTVTESHVHLHAAASASSVPIDITGTIGRSAFSGRFRYDRGSTKEDEKVRLKESRATSCCIGPAFAADAPPLTLSHAWIVVTTGAPERTVLEKAGFRIAPTVNRHEGQGTASVTVELFNGFLELIYPDPTVPVSPDLQAGAEKFRLKSAWRETGYSPIGVVFDRSSATPEHYRFATWKVSADWMEKGTFIEMMTPKEMPRAVSLSISSHPAITRESESENEMLARNPVKGAMFLHPNGARRLTRLRVVAPSADRFPPAASYIAGHGIVKFDVGSHWLLDVTLDNGAQGVTKNLEPDLPVVIHY